MMEAEKDLVAKMLRAVLQSNKDGVVIERLQYEYNSLTGERIPFKKLGYPTLEGYLKSVPSVVRLENVRGQVTCFAVVCKATEQIAKFVARQRSSKKRTGGQVNCQMRLKYTSPFMLFGKPKATLRQPGFANPYDMCGQRPAPALTRTKGFQWLNKPVLPPKATLLPPAPGILRDVVAQKQDFMANKSERRVLFTPQVPRDLHGQHSKNLNDNQNANTISQDKRETLPEHIDTFAVQDNIRQLLKKYSYGIWLSKLPNFYKETYKQNLDEKMISQLEKCPDVCTFERLSSGSHTDALLYPARSLQNLEKKSLKIDTNQNQEKISVLSLSSKPEALNKQSATISNDSLSSNLKEKLFELLQKYSSGLWVDALPKVFEDTYKERFPEGILQNLDLLSDSCTVDYISLNPKKAIIYAKSKTNQNVSMENEDLESLIEQVHFKESEENSEDIDPLPTIHPLIIPSEANPSVLVLELSNTNEVVIRYIGKDYSSAQDCIEDEMKEYYAQNSAESQTRSVRVGQMVAVNSEDNAWLRAQVISTDEEKIKVFYVDHGFTEMIERSQIRKLGRPFYSLPFQAAKCRLAGLEAFATDPVILKSVETKACGKILAAEILERSEIPIVVLYDTSGDEDININSSCLKDLYDQSLQLRVTVDAFYTNVKVTNVCSDGTLFCQLPSKGLKQLGDILSKIEDCFRTKQVTSELFISLPFDGKMCLFYSKGKYARVEITSVHSCRAVDVQFLDSGTINTVKVSELKEIPPEFLRDLICIPPQVLKCCLADLPSNISLWTPDAVLWLRDAVLNRADCSIKVVNIDVAGGMVHVFLFTPKELLHPDCSINRQITNANLWKHQMDVFLSVNPVGGSLVKDQGDDTRVPGSTSAGLRKELINPVKMPTLENKIVPIIPDLPPLLPLPKPGEQMDIYVSVACHPGHFVFQSWNDLHLLEVLMEEMVLHYSTAEEHTIPVEKNKLYAAKVENKWYRVLLKGILTNGLVSVYELDYGKHELVSCRKIQPLIDKFRQLPFQAVTAQLAGVKCEQWSEEAAIVFRNHVEKKPLVALVQSVVEAAEPWNRKVVAYIVDTSLPDTDLWIHYLMSQFLPTFSAA